METGKIKLTVGEITPETFADILKGRLVANHWTLIIRV